MYLLILQEHAIQRLFEITARFLNIDITISNTLELKYYGNFGNFVNGVDDS